VPDIYEASRDLDRLTSASIVYRGLNPGSRDPDVVKAIKAYTRAIAKLPPLARRVWDRTVKKLILADTGRSADASWLGAGRMELNVAKAPASVSIARNTVVHELGHALEDDLGIKVTTWDETPYGLPPYVSGWAESGGMDRGAEDFAETFRALVMEPGHLRKMAPEKYADMKSRV
jgi:hypothetical protein